MPNDIDLTTLAAVKSWTGLQNTTDDQIIQDCITAFSAYVLRRTGRGPADGSIPSESPLVAQVQYSETYDGTGTDRLFLKNWPIVSVSLLQIGMVQIPQSGAIGQAGYVIDGSGKSLALRNGAGNSVSGILTVGFFTTVGRGYKFVEGIQNVQVNYTAGFDGAPEDLEMCARKVVALNYKRRQWIGQRSQAMAGGAGTVSYGTWEMDADCDRTINYYRRRSFV